MKIFRNSKNLILILAILFSLLPSYVAAAPGDLQHGSWHTHSAFYYQVAKIIDTPQHTFFLLHTRLNDPTISTWDANVQTFYVDKNGQQEIHPISNKWECAQKPVIFAEYNSENHYLMLIYSSGDIDLLYDNGNIKSINAFANIVIPYDRTVNSASFCSKYKEIYISTACGYCVIDDSTGEMKRFVNFNKDITAALRVNNHLLLLANDCVYADNATSPASDFSALSPLAVSHHDNSPAWVDSSENLSNIDYILPAESGLLFLSNTSANTYVAGAAFPDAEGNWHACQLLSDTFYLSPKPLTSPLEASLPTMHKAWGVNAVSSFYSLSTLTTPDFDHLPAAEAMQAYVAQTVEKKAKTTASTIAGCYDFNTIWTYEDFEDFSTEGLDAATASPAVKNLHPDAPRYAVCTAMAYSPEYGLLTISHGNDWNFPETGGYVAAMLSGYKDGKWISYNPQTNGCTFQNATASALKNWNLYYKYQYPTTYPRGLAIDPDNPSFVYVGSIYHGISRMDMANPSLPALRMAQNSNGLKSYGGFAAIVGDLPWRAHCHFTAPQFDSNDILWSTYWKNDGGNIPLQLFYWLPEARRASANANNNPSEFQQWGHIDIPGVLASNYDKLLVLNHPDNANTLIYYSGIYGDKTTIINHNGTPADTSDDTITPVRKIIDQSGQLIENGTIHVMYEDPLTGNVWIGGNETVYYFKPADLAAGKNVITPNIRTKAGESMESVFSNVKIQSAARDDFGRLWLGSDGSGLYCLSSNLEDLLGHWTTADSDIPGNNIYSVCWDPSTNSMFASTENGIAQFFAPGSASQYHATTVKVSPRNVTPDYNGWVTISNLEDNAEYALTDEAGNVLQSLGSPVGGVIQAHLNDLEMVKTSHLSVYNITRQMEATRLRIMK